MKRTSILLMAAIMFLTLSSGCQNVRDFARQSMVTPSSLTEILPDEPVSPLYDSVFPVHEPYGKGVGAMPGRVVWTHNPDAVKWDGGGYWWEPEHFDEAVIQTMVGESIVSLGGKETVRDGWDALFTAHNTERGKSGGYLSGEKIAVKANINGSAVFDDDTSGETQLGYTNPVLLKTLLISLVNEAGIAPSDITVYDVSRLFPDYMVEMCTGGILQGINFTGRNNGIADESAPVNWSYEFSGVVNYLPACVTEAEYVINLANLKGHSYGITLCGKNHFGSFINGNMMRPPEGANLHQFLTRNEMGIYSPLTDLTANYQLGGKTVLYMMDALICAVTESDSITGDNSKWRQAPFNGHYTSSVFVSQDPVAIDSVGADFLINEPAVTEHNPQLRGNPNVENYLHESAIVTNPPSGTVYLNGNGEPVKNLGVHEHWNNPIDKRYSKNLGKGEGIELVYIKTPAATETGNSAAASIMSQPSPATQLSSVQTVAETSAQEGEKSNAMPNISITIGGSVFSARLYDNSSARALLEQLPMTLDMPDLNGNEKYYYLSDNLPTDSQRVGNIKNGDLMLYGSDCLVLFYESFSTSYSYTRLGYIENASGLAAALGSGSVKVAFAVAD